MLSLKRMSIAALWARVVVPSGLSTLLPMPLMSPAPVAYSIASIAQEDVSEPSVKTLRSLDALTS